MAGPAHLHPSVAFRVLLSSGSWAMSHCSLEFIFKARPQGLLFSSALQRAAGGVCVISLCCPWLDCRILEYSYRMALRRAAVRPSCLVIVWEGCGWKRLNQTRRLVRGKSSCFCKHEYLRLNLYTMYKSRHGCTCLITPALGGWGQADPPAC